MARTAGMYEPIGEKSSGGDQGQRNVVEGRENSGYKNKREGDGRGGVERVLKSVRRDICCWLWPPNVRLLQSHLLHTSSTLPSMALNRRILSLPLHTV